MYLRMDVLFTRSHLCSVYHWPPWGHHVLGFRAVWVQCARVSIEHGAPECLAV